MLRFVVFIFLLIITEISGQVLDLQNLDIPVKEIEYQRDFLSDATGGAIALTRFTEADSVPVFQIVDADPLADRDRGFNLYVNGQKIHPSIFRSMNAKIVENIEIKKDDVPTPEMYITLKPSYVPRFMSLMTLGEKYVGELDSGSLIFILDGETVFHPASVFMIDERYIMKVVVEKDVQGKVTIVRLMTRSEENIKKANGVFIRS